MAEQKFCKKNVKRELFDRTERRKGEMIKLEVREKWREQESKYNMMHVLVFIIIS
jgi:hypothetical protein